MGRRTTNILFLPSALVLHYSCPPLYLLLFTLYVNKWGKKATVLPPNHLKFNVKNSYQPPAASFLASTAESCSRKRKGKAERIRKAAKSQRQPPLCI